MGVDVGLVGEVDGGRESAGSLGLAEFGSMGESGEAGFCGCGVSGLGFLTVWGRTSTFVHGLRKKVHIVF